MCPPPGKMAIMGSLLHLVLALAVAAAFAADIPTIKPEDKLSHHCEVVAPKAVALKGKDIPLYQCASETGARFLLAADSTQESLETVINGDAILKLKELSRPKRQFGFGGGGAFSNANSQASSFGGGFGGGGFPGYGGGGFGGGGAGASSSANAGSFGGGFGGFGR